MRLLVVDERVDVVETLRFVLRDEGFELRVVRAAALDDAACDEHDVAVVDGREALAILDRLQDLDPTLPVVVIAARGTFDEALRRAARDYVELPLDTTRLIVTLRREAGHAAVVRRARHLEEELARAHGAPTFEVDGLTLEQIEVRAIQRALARTGGNVTEAAVALGLSRSALYRRLQQYPIRSVG